MYRTVILRDFEDRDVDFIYRCKNDKELNRMIVGLSHPISYEAAIQWVHNCMKGDRQDLKFWAVAINNLEKRIVGWVSLSEIDLVNKSACHHGLVIGDPAYRDGTAMYEAMLLSIEYAFCKLNLHRVYGCCLSEHKITPLLMHTLGFTLEGKSRAACYKNGRYYDINDYSILDYEYEEKKRKGDYEPRNLVRNFIKGLKGKK